MRNTLLCMLLLGGCAPTDPYIAIYQTAPWTGDWFGDGAPLRIDVVNPHAEDRHVELACFSADVLDRWEVDVAAHGEERMLVQLLQRDNWNTACWMERYEPRRHLRHKLQRLARREHRQ